MNLKDIVKNFDIKGNIVNIKENNVGNVNKTYIITVENLGKKEKYILQKINTSVFNEPYLLMRNIKLVTEYYNNYHKEHNINTECIHVIKTKNGDNLIKIDNDQYYRMYNYIEDAITYNKIENIEIFKNVGKAFGNFAKILNAFPMEQLHETIKNFHNSKIRYKNFLKDIKNDVCGRKNEVINEIKFIMDRESELCIIADLIEKNKIPVRVTHNDTKINNILINKYSNEPVCVIDLDTVMPGSILYDFGDAIRSGAVTVEEDNSNFDQVHINLDYFEAFTKSYLEETKNILTDTEKKYLVFSVKLLTLELAMRFLNDYINGDTYFKCNYEKHNLIRARNQISLVKDIEKNYYTMEKIVDTILNKDNTKKILNPQHK